MKTPRFALLLAVAVFVLLCCSHKSSAQSTDYWTPGLWFSGGAANYGCVHTSGNGAACPTADADCHSVATNEGAQQYYMSPGLYVQNGNSYYTEAAVCNYYYQPWFEYVPYLIGTTCPSGLVSDINTPGGCAPPLGMQPIQLIGGMPSQQLSDDTNPDCDCSASSGQSNSGDESQQSDPVTTRGTSTAGDPIDIGSGNVFYYTTDYATPGQNKLTLMRFYNSRVYSGTMFGAHWRSNYDRYLYIAPGTVMVERADGQKLYFAQNNSGVWVPENTDQDYSLTASGSGHGATWTLTNPDDSVESYTATSSNGNFAMLEKITLRNGYSQTLTYNSVPQLTSVADSYGRTLTFTVGTNGLFNTVTTPEGTVLNYGYTAIGSGDNLTSVTWPTSPTTSTTYVYGNTGLPNALTSITDEDGNTYASWTYDQYGRGLTSQLGSGANLVTVTYNDSTGSRTVTNALGVTDTYAFTTFQGVPKVTGISRAATSTTPAMSRSITYDSDGFKASETDWNGNSTTYVNNSYGLPTTINEAVGSSVARTTTIAYDPTWVRLPHTVTTSGVTATYSYDSYGEVLTKTLTDTTTTTSPYSTNGQTRTWTNTWSDSLLATAKTPNNHTTTFGYDSTGALTSITDALTHVTTISSHTGGGLPLTVVDPNGVTTTLTYDPRQRLLTSSVSTSSGSRTTTNSYDDAENLTSVALPDSSALTYTYDHAHRLTSVTNSDGDNINFTLDALGDITQTLWKDSGGTTRRQQTATFDALGRKLSQTGVSGETTTLTWDKNSNALTVQDGLSHTTTRVFDALNRLHTSTDANSGVTTLAYDAHDRLLSLTDARSNATSHVYDGFGDAIELVSPDSGTSVFHFDSDGNLTQKTDALSVVTNQSFDALDRIITRTYPSDSTLNATFNYDETGGDFAFTIGRLSSITDAAGYTYRSYDERGNTIKIKRTSGTNNFNLHFSYDAASRLANIDYPSGLDIGYVRDSAGLVAGLAYVPPGGSSGINIANVYYRPFGPMYSYNLTNGLHTTLSYDQDYRLTGISDTSSILNLTYAWDNASNVSSITDSLHAANTQTFGYDVLNRLTSAVSGTGGYGTLGWSYDKVGNLLTQTAAGVTTTYTPATTSNRLASWLKSGVTTTVSTNANGNITSIPPAGGGSNGTFAYNAANRLKSVTGTPLAATYAYDSLGTRFSKTQSGYSPSYYTYGMDGAMLEENDNGTVTDYVYLDGKPVAVFVPGATPPTTSQMYDLHNDMLGTPQYATNSSKAVVWSAGNYQPYGKTGTTSGTLIQNLRLPGQYMDSETGFNYNLNRDYMPNLGRYLESDPIGLAGGMNGYLYAAAAPLTYPDKEGLAIYRVNRDLSAFGVMPEPQGDFVSHTFIAVTDDDGNVTGTYSWGNAQNLQGWNVNQSIDMISASIAIHNGMADEVDSSLDPYVGSAFNQINNSQDSHPNMVLFWNCKAETNHLLNQAQSMRDAVQQYNDAANQFRKAFQSQP